MQTKGLCKTTFSAITTKKQTILFIVNYALKIVFKMTVKLRGLTKPDQENKDLPKSLQLYLPSLLLEISL